MASATSGAPPGTAPTGDRRGCQARDCKVRDCKVRIRPAATRAPSRCSIVVHIGSRQEAWAQHCSRVPEPPHPNPLPYGASLGTHLMMRFGLALGESRVILSLPSRFGRLSDGRDGYWIFWRRASKKNGAQLLGRVCERQTVCLRRLGDNRAEKVRFRRFLMNDRVTVEKMLARLRARVAEAAAGLHVLAIQDTRQIHYGSKRARKRGLGTVGNGSDVGLFVHPVLTVDAATGHCLGLADVQVWRRFKKKAANYRKQPIEDKESYPWLKCPRRAKSK